MSAASLRRSGTGETGRELTTEGMGKAEESQDSADSKEVGFKRSYPQGIGPSACPRCFCSLPAPETSEPAWQMAAFTEARLLPRTKGAGTPAIGGEEGERVQYKGLAASGRGAWTSSPCLWWGCSGRQGSDGKGGEQTK